MAYRIEVSNNRRAGCKNTECKREGIKIEKGDLRFATWVTFGEHQNWSYKHWGCVTPLQLSRVKEAIEGDFSMFDGYEDLPRDLQEKVERALENGHVDDEDWKGDLDKNRPGQKGFRSPAPKAKKKKVASDEGSEDERSKSPPKTSPKKRHRAKKENLDDEELEEPIRKKSKAAGNRGRMVKKEEVSDENLPKKTIATKPKASRKKVKLIKKEEAMDSLGDVAVKTSGSTGSTIPAGDLDPEFRPKKTARRKRKAEKTNQSDEDDASDGELLSPSSAKPGCLSSKTATVVDEGPKQIKDDPNDNASSVFQPAQEVSQSRKRETKATTPRRTSARARKRMMNES